MAKKIKLEVFLYRPDEQEKPTWKTYEIPYKNDWVILDALNFIKDHIDGTLSFRWSCRMGICGSCGMMVNGVPKLTCATFLRNYYPEKVRVEPLYGFPVERDLVIVMDDFMNKLNEIRPWIVRKKGEERPVERGEYRQTPTQLAQFKQFSMCINCMLCYASCPVYVVDDSFIGPAAIALAQRYNKDSRDQGSNYRERVITKHEGIWECTFVGECSVVCPEDVDPAAAIQQAKITSTQNYFKSLLLPLGGKK